MTVRKQRISTPEIGKASKFSFRVKYLRKSRQIWRNINKSKPWVDMLYKDFLGIGARNMRIVDVGCGTGDFTRYLARLSNGKSSILGIDSNPKSIPAAIADTKKSGLAKAISYRLGDVYNIPVNDNYADLTCCRAVLMHLRNPLLAVKEMVRITRPSGTVVAIEGSKMGAFFDPEDEVFNF